MFDSVLSTLKERDEKVLKLLKKTSDNYAVYSYLKQGKTLTASEAIQMGLSYDLKSRISDLKKKGAIIRATKPEGKRHHVYALEFGDVHE
ncbi:MAG: hypothetical protein WCR98_05060 [Saccharofermentanales bacterium]